MFDMARFDPLTITRPELLLYYNEFWTVVHQYWQNRQLLKAGFITTNSISEEDAEKAEALKQMADVILNEAYQREKVAHQNKTVRTQQRASSIWGVGGETSDSWETDPDFSNRRASGFIS